METKENRAIIVAELTELINKGNAHLSVEDAVAGIDLKLLTVIPEHLPYNVWQLIEHIRITQWDIVEFCLSADHVSPEWPAQYWPEPEEKADQVKLDSSLKQIKADRERFFALLNDPDRDLYTPFPYGDGQNLFKEALLIADHTSYHLGELIVLRRLLGNWTAS